MSLFEVCHASLFHFWPLLRTGPEKALRTQKDPLAALNLLVLLTPPKQNMGL